MSLLPPDTQQQFERFKAHVHALTSNAQTLLTMLSAQPQAGGTTPDKPPLTHLERASVRLALAQVMHALHMMHVKAGGLDPQKHFQADVHKASKRRRPVCAGPCLLFCDCARSMCVQAFRDCRHFVTATRKDCISP